MEKIEIRFEQFMNNLPSVELIDELDTKISPAPEKADYFGLGRRIIFEQKNITKDQARKLQDFVERFKNEDWFPVFYGERDINLVLKESPQKDEILNNIVSITTRLVSSYFKKANSQISSTKQIFDLPDAFGVLVILNDSVKVLSPQILARRIQSLLQEKDENEGLKFAHIDSVYLISETHLYKGNNPTILIIDRNVQSNRGISEYLDYLTFSWGLYNGGRVEHIEKDEFAWDDIIERNEIPDSSIKRHEARRLWYEENPYMREWTDQEVFEFGAKVLEMTAPFMIKGGKKIPAENLAEMTLVFGDFIAETNFRGLDIREFEKHVDRDSIRRAAGLSDDECD